MPEKVPRSLTVDSSRVVRFSITVRIKASLRNSSKLNSHYGLNSGGIVCFNKGDLY